MFVVLLHEYVKKKRMLRTENFYSYLGMFDFDNGFPIFKKGLILNSQKFRSVIIYFRPFYFKILEHYAIDDTMDYDKMLEFSSTYPSVSTTNSIFSGFSPNSILDFMNDFAALILE